jgi:hypothetical protein
VSYKLFFEHEGGFMTYLKRLGLTAAAIAFLMSVSALSSSAQTYRDRSWQNRGYYGQNTQYRRYRRGGRVAVVRVYRSYSRPRYQVYRRTNRYYGNTGYLSYWERRRLARRYYQYRRNVSRSRYNVYQTRRNW